ncbi:MAG: DUF4040 domain-containing protein [Rickettsiaceae bacterium H1]|nr:DUF4040 domain-containing protein [Rickettsiaceae bacterium H1]
MTMILPIILLLIVITLAILSSHNLLTDIVLLSIFSFLMAALYSIMNAPDVAITEASVNAALGTIFMLSALLYRKENSPINRSKAFWPGIIMLSTLVLILPILLIFPELGSPSSPVNNEVSHYYITKTIEKLGFTNIVTGILASFRGFDTLIETVVIFTAGNSVYMLISDNEKK